MRKSTLLCLCVLYLATALRAGQVYCVQQPPPELRYKVGGAMVQASEWACVGMSHEEAWALLAQSGAAPIRSVNVRRLGERKKGRGKLVAGLKVLAAVGVVAATKKGLSKKARGALVVGPGLAAWGVEAAGNKAGEFTPTPSVSGFVTIYSLRDERRVVLGYIGPMLVDVPIPVATPGVPETGRNDAPNDAAVLMQNDARFYMNEAEALAIGSP